MTTLIGYRQRKQSRSCAWFKRWPTFPALPILFVMTSHVLSEQVRRTLFLEDGRRYTEKILQEVIHLPPQEPFALRRALKSKLQRALPKEFAEIQGNRDAEYRQHLLFDVWAGEFLTTPRDVARTLNSMALNWPLLPPHSDFCDLLWLQLLKLKSHDLYTWTREYLTRSRASANTMSKSATLEVLQQRLDTRPPLRFANPSPPSGWIEDFHLQAVVHTRHTTKTPPDPGDQTRDAPPLCRLRQTRHRRCKSEKSHPKTASNQT